MRTIAGLEDADEGTAEIVGDGGDLALSFGDGRQLSLPEQRRGDYAGRAGTGVTLGVRPEHMERGRGGDPRPGLDRLRVTIDLVQPTGSRTYGTFKLGETEVPILPPAPINAIVVMTPSPNFFVASKHSKSRRLARHL